MGETMEKVKELPIIMQADSVKVILAGRKTQTRRVADIVWDTSRYWGDYDCWTARQRGRPRIGFSTENGGQQATLHLCPLGSVGRRLWVRETWSPDHSRFYPHWRVVYKADDYPSDHDLRKWKTEDDPDMRAFRWRSPLHMPRWASRLTLEVTGVRVERVQDISEADIWAEGVQRCSYRHGAKPHIVFCDDGPDGFVPDPVMQEGGRVHSPQAAFHEIWDRINAARGYPWSSNCWVWVIEFRVVPQSEVANES